MNDVVGRAVIRMLLSSLAVTATGCQVASNLVPRTLARSVSPDGRHTASVWRAPLSIRPMIICSWQRATDRRDR